MPEHNAGGKVKARKGAARNADATIGTVHKPTERTATDCPATEGTGTILMVTVPTVK